MNQENFAGDEERLRALLSDISSNDTGLLTIDQTLMSEQMSRNISDFEEENDIPENDDIPTTDEDEPSEPDDSDADINYEPSSEDETSDSNSTSSVQEFLASTPKKRGRPTTRLEKIIAKRSRKLVLSSPPSPIRQSPIRPRVFEEEMIDDPDPVNEPYIINDPVVNETNVIVNPDMPTDAAINEQNLPVGPDEIIREEAPNLPQNEPVPNEGNDEDPWEEVGPETDFPLRPVTYNELSGPKHMPTPDSPPVTYFNLFFTTLLLQSIVRETNRYATQCLERSEFSDNSRAKKWLPTCIPEVKGFIACLINMGLIRKPTIFSYWSTLPSMATPWFSQMFTRDRFQLLLRFFHLVNNDAIAQRGFDPCAKFQPLVDHANILFRHYYTPHEQLSVDESLIGTKSHTILQQYLPKKQHHRWGIKVWMLCDSVANYVLGFFIYKGARAPSEEKKEQKEFGQGFVVVKKLLTLGNYLNKGFHVFTDNFFASIPLATRLYELGTYYTATIRANRKGLPEAIKSKFDVGVTKFFKKGFLMLCGFRDRKSQKKQVLLVSTASQATTSEIRRRVRRQAEEEVVNKPDVILEYNKYMGGIDISDMMVYAYLDERRTVKFWKKVVFSIFSRMLLNAYILYKENVKLNGNGKPMTRLKFMESLVHELGKEWNLAKKQASAPQPQAQQGPSNFFGVKKLPGRKLRLCKECSTENNKHRSAFVCVRCNKGLHPECIQQHKC